jgi:hypothetical protein
MWIFVFVVASPCLKQGRPGFEKPEYKIFSRKFFEAVPRPDFCDGKNLSRGLILPAGSIKDGVRRYESGSQNFSAEKYL